LSAIFGESAHGETETNKSITVRQAHRCRHMVWSAVPFAAESGHIVC